VKWLLCLTASLLVITALLVGGCGGPKAIPPLTEDDKDAMIKIALADPQVSGWLDEANEYTVYERWVVIAWEDSKAVGWYRVEYEDIKDGKPPADRKYVTDDVTISPELYFHIGEPARMYISVIFDSDMKKIISVEPQPGRPSAGPTPVEESHPAGLENLRPLTSDERARIIDTALFNTKAAKYLNEYNHYEIDVSWIAIVWEDSEPVEWWGIKSDWENDPNFGLVSGEAEFYSRVVINFGEPLQWQVMAAINPETGKVALAEENPFRTGPEPPE
jgi:hypothetical protein